MEQKYHYIVLLISIVATISVVLMLVSYPQSQPSQNKLFIIVIDGFASSYLNSALFLQHLAEKPFSNATALTVFPPITPAAHASLLTGAPPEEHGIVNYNSTSLHVTTFFERLPENIKTCAFYAKNSLQPFFSLADEVFAPARITSVENIDYTILDKSILWSEEDKCDFYLLSLPYTDAIGHLYGPRSEKIQNYIEKLDKKIEYFTQQFPDATIIITSDHGMCDINGRGQHSFMDDNCAKQIPILVYNSDSAPMSTIMEIYNFTISFYS